MGGIDLLVLDDDRSMITAIGDFSKLYELECVFFSSGSETLRYLRGCVPDQLPRGYLVDMRIGNTEDELRSPLDIFNLLKEYGATKYFRFYTGHYSIHDGWVKGMTGAEVIIKTEIEKLFEFFRELSSSKPQK